MAMGASQTAAAIPSVFADDHVELAQAAPGGAQGEAIGTVSAVEGQVTITHADGSKVEAATGAPIFQGDLVETKGAGAVGITFADDTTFSLADNGSMTIDEMVYDPAAQKGKATLSVAEGVFTFVSGQIAKTDVDAMSIKTPVATIGIRGTAGGGKAGPEGTPNTFSMFSDPNGANGEMSIRTQGGNVIFSKALQTTQVSSAFVPPLKPIVLPPGVAAQFYAKATATGTVKPSAPPPTGNQGGATGDQGGPTGNQGGEPTAADAAAAEAFANALSQGASLDQAIGAAAGAAATVEFQEVLNTNPEAFGTPGAGEAIISGLVAKTLGNLAASLGLGGNNIGGGGDDTLPGGAGDDAFMPPSLPPPPPIVITFQPLPPPPVELPPILPPPPPPGETGATVASLVSAISGGFPGLSVVAGTANFQGDLSGTSAANFATVNLGTVEGISYSISRAGILLTSGALPGTTNTLTDFSGQASGLPVQNSTLASILSTQLSVTTTDATVLSFQFTVTDPNVTHLVFDWMFGSEEYPDQNVTDIAAIVVDGTNYLKFSGDNSAVQFRVGNNISSFANNNGTGALAIEYDGVARPETVAALLNSQLTTHTLDIVVADTSDNILDSGMWIAARGLAMTTIGNRDVTTGDDILVSRTASDTVTEVSGNNTVFLLGGGGNTFTDGSGNDTVYGGLGNDTINLAAGTNLASGGVGDDTFTIATAAVSTNTVFGGDDGTGEPIGDTISFAGASVAITATVGANTTTVVHGGGSTVFTEVENLTGTALNDTFTTNVDVTNNDLNIVNGGAGDDTFTIGASAVVNGGTLDGSTGTDTLDLSARTDTVSSSGDFNVNGLSVGTGSITTRNFENLLTGSGADDVTVEAAVLENHTINGGAGTDTLRINNNTSTVLTEAELVNVANWETWLLQSSVAYSITSNDANVAAGQSLTVNLTGASGTLIFDGTAEADGTFTIIGNAGVDTLTGGAGNDSITGAAGADTLSGGGGNDTFLFAASNFAASESVDGGTGTDTLSVSGSNTFSAGTLTSIEALTYTATATATFGSSQVGTGQIATVSGNNGTVNTFTVNTTSSLDVSGVTFNNWESTDVINLVGSTANNTIVGSDQADIITGGNGTDTLTGGAGNDTFAFAAGDFQGDGPGQQPDESANGGAGTDTLSLSGGNNFTVGTLTSIEALTFTASATATFSGSQVNTAAQLASNLAVTASAGSDAVVVEVANSGLTVDLSNWTFTNWAAAGTDTITINGTTGIDDINGSQRNDTINGGLGGDTLSGDGGADTINLGVESAVTDIVVYHTLNDGASDLNSANADTVNQFVAGEDKISFDDTALLTINAVTSVATADAKDLTAFGVFFISDSRAAIGDPDQVVTAIGAITGETANNKAVFLIQNAAATQTGVYAFTAADANNAVSSSELQLLAVVDTAITNADIAFETPAVLL